ncbi:MAG: preprotein translocase subunit SecE [Legionellales bacterium RIFCSPHIGHO2_12_FULL_37_14]|nr:MAG: preprotein translocase subunit SecE [Legionellales bacterium RIFCSPHIGHO2_12_FULL_37_14]
MIKSKELGLWIAVILVTLASFYLTYGLHFSGPIIAIIWIMWLILSAALAYFTAPGQAVCVFAKDAKIELLKVVWPTRKETVQTTMVVMAMVGITGIILWGLDSIMMFSIAKITHLG